MKVKWYMLQMSTLIETEKGNIFQIDIKAKPSYPIKIEGYMVTVSNHLTKTNISKDEKDGIIHMMKDNIKKWADGLINDAHLCYQESYISFPTKKGQGKYTKIK